MRGIVRVVFMIFGLPNLIGLVVVAAFGTVVLFIGPRVNRTVLLRGVDVLAGVVTVFAGVVISSFAGIKPAPWLPLLVMENRGARSGQPRRTPLFYGRDGDDLVIIASNGGNPRHPAWYHNVRAHPEVTVWLRRRSGPYRARIAEGPERERLWKLITDLNPGYDIYKQRASHRTIPVVVLSPTGA
jgi:deazaflavin-dependent oxidoreductase (nitroreductase family)